MSVYDFLLGVRKVTRECYVLFAPFYQERAKHYVYPAFYQSITQMIAAGGFYFKVFNAPGQRTLAIFKRSTIMGNCSVMLHIAPISDHGNKVDELEIMQSCRKLGISLKLCFEDIGRYGIPVKLLEPIRGNVEYVYDVNECYESKGGKFHSFRRAVKRITKREDYGHLFGAHRDVGDLVKRWDEHNRSQNDKSRSTSQYPDWKRISKIDSECVVIHRVYAGDSLEVFSVIERLAPKHWALVMGMRNYGSRLNDVNACMHWLDCEVCYDARFFNVYANMGASLGIGGLSDAKEKLKPCAHLQIYRMRPLSKFNYETIKRLFE